MKGKYNVITIERQYASGGREIGRLLADRLSIQFYNEEILKMASESLNMPQDYIRDSEETVPGSFIYGLVMAANADNIEGAMSVSDRLFFEESKVIKGLASGEPCVIVGRCARQILSNRTDCLNVFIYSDTDARIQRAINEYGIKESEAESVLKKNDKRRTNFYNIRASRKWNDIYAYDICLNSASIGIEGSVEAIAKIFGETRLGEMAVEH